MASFFCIVAAIAATSVSLVYAANCGPADLTELTGGQTFSNEYLHAASDSMCGGDTCQVQPQDCSRQMRLSNDFIATLTAKDANSKWTHCSDAFDNIISSCFDLGSSAATWELDGESYYLNVTKTPFVPYVFQPGDGETLQNDYHLPEAPAILTHDYRASATQYQSANPPYTTNGMACTPVYANRPVCTPVATTTAEAASTPVCGNLGNPQCTGLTGITPTPGVQLTCAHDCVGAIPDPQWCNDNCK